MRLFVSNINFEASESDVHDLFVEGGHLPVKVKLGTDRATGAPRGFAFVTMPDAAAAREAMSDMDGQVLMGRRINVQEARPPEQAGSDRGGGDRGRYSGRDRNSYAGRG